MHLVARAVRAGLFGVLSAVAVLICGCGGDDQKANGEPEAKPITRTAERGPVKLTVTADKDRITIAEKLHLTIEAEAAAGVEVTLPEFGEQLSEFQIRSFADNPAADDGQQRHWRQEYELDIFLSGEYTIPPVTARFVDSRKSSADPSAAPIEGEIETEPITIEVRSLLSGEFDPTQFRDIKGAVPLPADPARTWLWVGGVVIGGVAVAVIAGAWWIRRSRRPERRRRIAPHDWAFDELRALIDEQLIEQGQVQEFFYRLSEITRMYIEVRFGLMAAEQTTEEFLADAQSSAALSADHKRLLTEFLQACDLVKFARYEPGNEEIERAFNSARDFVEQTKPSAEPAAMEAAA